MSQCQHKVGVFIDAQVKILLDCQRLRAEGAGEEAQSVELTGKLEAAMAAEDFGSAAGLQKALETCQKNTVTKKDLADKNETRYQRGEEAKFKMMSNEIDFRGKQLEAMQTVRLDREASYASFVRDQGGKLKAAEVPPPPTTTHHSDRRAHAGASEAAIAVRVWTRTARDFNTPTSRHPAG